METVDGGRKEAVHRRGEATSRDPHEGTPRLQVPATTEDEDPDEEGQIRPARHGPRARTTGRTRHVPHEHERVHAERVSHDAPRPAHGLPTAGDDGADERHQCAVRLPDARADDRTDDHWVIHERQLQLHVLNGALLHVPGPSRPFAGGSEGRGRGG